jgi:hypothetical protein
MKFLDQVRPEDITFGIDRARTPMNNFEECMPGAHG